MAEDNLRDTQDDFELVELIYSTNRETNIVHNIVHFVTDFEIFEHIDKPFISMQLALVDTMNFVQSVDLQGGESLKMTIQSRETKGEGASITKNFIIDKIIKSQRSDDKTEVFYLHCFEDIVLKSSLINVNRFYNDKPTNIVANIMNEYLNKGTTKSLDEFQSNMQVVIPNMHPIDAASWIKNRITSIDGLPYYLYSTFSNNNMFLIDLGQLLTRDPINKNAPFTYIKVLSQQQKTDNFVPILSYKHENVDDILSLIRNGHVGSNYNFLNTLTGRNTSCAFDVKADVFDQLKDNAIFKKQKRYNYGSGEKVDDKPLSEYQSKTITRITGNGAYRMAHVSVRSADEEHDISSYKKRITGNALKSFMTKAPITISVQGRPFFRGVGDYSIGNVIRLLFLDSQRKEDAHNGADHKKSGDYLMYAAKHSFSIRNPNRIVSDVLCARISMQDKDLSVGDFMKNV